MAASTASTAKSDDIKPIPKDGQKSKKVTADLSSFMTSINEILAKSIADGNYVKFPGMETKPPSYKIDRDGDKIIIHWNENGDTN